MAETEPFGVVYERYALGHCLNKIVDKYKIKTVLEMPAGGAKAAPSLYSLDLALAGCKVTLVNGNSKSLRFYKDLGVEENVEFIEVDSLHDTYLPSKSYDMVWNFAFIPTYPEKELLIREMTRLSRGYVSIFSVNRLNIGFPMHRFAHRYAKVPWTHGDISYNSPFFLKKFFARNYLKVVESGVVDCPPWPDSIGFRDIRLHKSNKDFNCVDWEVPYISCVKVGAPNWVKGLYLLERLPIPLLLKYIYSHIFYLVGKKA